MKRRLMLALFATACGSGYTVVGEAIPDVSKPESTPWVWVADQGPAPRRAASMAFDLEHARTVLFGGDAATGTLSDTWTWDGVGWSELSTRDHPSQGARHAMAYDQRRRRIVLVGGKTLNETWELDGSTWTKLDAAAPSGVAQLLYDSEHGKVVMLTTGNTFANQWAWDGTTWQPTSLRPPDSSDAAYDLVLHRFVAVAGFKTWVARSEWTATSFVTPLIQEVAFDLSRQRVVGILFGDFAGRLPTVELDGPTWVEEPIVGPSGRLYPSVAYDSIRGRMVLFGGQLGNGNFGNDTWER